jgi:cbb3-type cytochrome oxidase subunit 3
MGAFYLFLALLAINFLAVIWHVFFGRNAPASEVNHDQSE